MKKRLQTGFAHLALLLLLAVVVVVALVGYKVWNNRNSSTTSSAGTSQTAQSAQAIKSSADLNKAESTLNSQNIDGDLNPDSLNNDVSTLL